MLFLLDKSPPYTHNLDQCPLIKFNIADLTQDDVNIASMMPVS